MKPSIREASRDPLVSVILGLSACGDLTSRADEPRPESAASDDPGETLEGVDWADWTPVYDELRPATRDVVDPIRTRVATRNTTSWTGHDAESGADIAYTPEHVRLSWDHLVVHLDPRDDPYDRTLTVCLEDGCSDIGPDDEPSSTTEALLRDTVPAMLLLQSQLEWQANLDEMMEEGVNRVATVETPAGPWDCFVHGLRARELDDLEGTEVVMAPPEDGDFDTVLSLCVDQRGLVVLDLTLHGVTARYDAWHADVDGDVTALEPADPLPEPPPVDPTGEYDEAAWAGWDGAFGEVRLATQHDVAELRARIRDRNATAWTGVVDRGWTLSVTPDHVRAEHVDLEWHFDPSDHPFEARYVLCHDGECRRVGSDAQTDGPHVFNNYLDSMTFLLRSRLYMQFHEKVVELDGPTALAAVDSPVGPLDCLVPGRTRHEVLALEGTPVLREHDAMGGNAALCVDQRGLVMSLVDPLENSMVLSSWHEGVDDDYDTYPGPVRDYND